MTSVYWFNVQQYENINEIMVQETRHNRSPIDCVFTRRNAHDFETSANSGQ